MKKLITLMAIMCAMASSAYADDCADRAAEKKLAGAAKNSFMKKCTADAQKAQSNPACDAKAQEKKLAGAAKNSFLKKCVADHQAAAK
jgi:opacity protein-like surface antigen